MATLGEIMDAMAEQLEDTLQPVSPVTLHIEPRAFSVAEMPAIDLLIANPTGLEQGLAGFHQRYGGIPITIRVRVATADVYTGQDILLGLMDEDGDLSIIAALDADHTLGGVVDDIRWSDGFPWAGYLDFPYPNGDGFWLGSTLTIVVLTSHS